MIGQQFAWTFEYPQGPGKPPLRTNQLYLKENQPVKFDVKSQATSSTTSGSRRSA